MHAVEDAILFHDDDDDDSVPLSMLKSRRKIAFPKKVECKLCRRNFGIGSFDEHLIDMHCTNLEWYFRAFVYSVDDVKKDGRQDSNAGAKDKRRRFLRALTRWKFEHKGKKH